MGRKSVPKRQHFVPASYLKRWVPPHESSLFAFDKSTGKVHQAAPADTAVQKHFYHMPGEDQDLEQKFSRIEGEFKPVADEIIKREATKRLRRKDRRRLDQFLAFQLMRTQEQRKTVEQIVDPLLHMVRKHGTEELKAQAEGWDARDIHLALLRDAEGLVPFVARLTLVTVRNGTPRSFTTSDHPVVRQNTSPLIAREDKKLGLGSPGVELHLALSPLINLVALDLPAPIERVFPRRIVANEENVLNQRWLQFANAGRFVYSVRDDFDLEHDWCAKHPGLAKESRQRIMREGGPPDGTPTPVGSGPPEVAE